MILGITGRLKFNGIKHREFCPRHKRVFIVCCLTFSCHIPIPGEIIPVIYDLYIFTCLLQCHKAFERPLRVCISQVGSIGIRILQFWISANFCKAAFDPFPNPECHLSCGFLFLNFQFDGCIFCIDPCYIHCILGFCPIRSLVIRGIFIHGGYYPLVLVSFLGIAYLVTIHLNRYRLCTDIASWCLYFSEYIYSRP